MKPGFVDFKTIKAAVTIEQVLAYHGIDWLRKTGNELRGRCPIHSGAEGDRAFHVNVEKNIFHCFSCGAKGGVLELAAALDGVSIREAGLKLQDVFIAHQGSGERRTAGTARTGSKPAEQVKEPEVINPPLTFQLRVESSHEYGLSRGLTRQTLEEFGAGMCASKGTFAGRFVIPLHDETGVLVGYAGRSVDGKEPKYLFPASARGFHKKYLLFNLHRVVKNSDFHGPVVVVEGFFDCMKVQQAGFACVGILGAALSQEQEDLLCKYFPRGVVLCFDGDSAGRGATEDCIARLVRRVLLKAIYLPEGQQPDMLSSEQITELIGIVPTPSHSDSDA
jgi:DNA primase